ncbi:hypothetical protein P2318_18745 [Myxococcaceae bacterium GXIMD 01537]
MKAQNQAVSSDLTRRLQVSLDRLKKTREAAEGVEQVIVALGPLLGVEGSRRGTRNSAATAPAAKGRARTAREGAASVSKAKEQDAAGEDRAWVRLFPDLARAKGFNPDGTV